MLKIICFVFAFYILTMPFAVSAKSCRCGNHGLITASGAGTVKIKPDGSRLYVIISIFNKSHTVAYSNLLKEANKVTRYFDNLNIITYPKSKRTFLIKTTQINISPNRIYKKGNWINDGYNATENLTVKIHGNKNTNNAVLYLLRHKSVEIGRIVSTNSNMEQFKIKAVKLAYNHAILKVKAILKLLNVKSYTVKTVNIKSAVQRVFYPPLMRMAGAAISPINKTKQMYFSGKNKITATVLMEVVYADSKQLQ